MELRLPEVAGVTWAVSVRSTASLEPASWDRRDGSTDPAQSGTPLSSLRADAPLRTASIGKVLLLLETARAIVAGSLSGDQPLTRESADWVRDSGLWHTLRTDTLPLADVAALVASVSDNLATNVLLRTVTLEAVAGTAAYLGLVDTALHDRVRDDRGPGHPPTLSTGTAAELSGLLLRVATGTALGPEADALVRRWLSGNVDQSMVGRAFVDHAGLDPLAHHFATAPEPALWNKTGTDAGMRADVGAVTRSGTTVTWAVLANWDPGPSRAREDRITWAVLRGLALVGEFVLDAL